MKKIAIIGAFDRYNYGDILFPIILSNFFENKYNINYIALSKGDLTSIGGCKTDSLSYFYKNINNFDSAIVSGGDVLSVDIVESYIDLSKNYFQMLLNKIIKKTNKNKLMQVAQKKFELQEIYPWIVNNNNNNNNNIKIIYNSVGGSGLLKKDKDTQRKIISKVNLSNYISVRDEITHSLISNSILCPDSATIISDYFSANFLEKHCNKDVISFINSKKYFCFQTNYVTFKKYGVDSICEQLNKIILDGYNVLLLPIGFATNHDDLIGLRKIKKFINNKNVYLFEQLNIYEITYLIVNSVLFVGSSLHGNIISMSYGIPHIGINKDIVKLDNYLKTWEKYCTNHCIDINELYNCFITNIKKDRNDLIEQSKILKGIVYKNLNNIKEVIDE